MTIKSAMKQWCKISQTAPIDLGSVSPRSVPCHNWMRLWAMTANVPCPKALHTSDPGQQWPSGLGVHGCECAKSSEKMSESGKLQILCRRKSLLPATWSYTHFCNPDFLHNNSRFFCARLNLHTRSDPERGKSSVWKDEAAIARRCCGQPSWNKNTTLCGGAQRRKSNKGFYNTERL